MCIHADAFFLYELKLCPFLFFIAHEEYRPAEEQIHTRAYRHADSAHVEPQPEQRGEEQPRGNSQHNGDCHGEFDIARRPESVAERSGKGVCECVYGVIYEHHNERKMLRLVGYRKELQKPGFYNR